MSFRFLNRFRIAAVLACSVVVAGVQAGEAERPQKPSPTPKWKISKKPYLVAVGPAEIYVKPVAGPAVRRPPLLPRPEPVEVAPKSSEPAATTPAPVEPSVLSPDAATTLLPGPKAPVAPAPVKTGEPNESVLAPDARAEMELRDSVIYFDAPVGRNGARVSLPVPVQPILPTAVAPPSSATYRKEKE